MWHCYKLWELLLNFATLKASWVLNLNNNKYFSGPYREDGNLKKCQAFYIHNIAYQGRFTFLILQSSIYHIDSRALLILWTSMTNM
ncbi:unnamed protein product, partial [Vitis vinifera]|uniref:Uncharacterized protein n=1 Tax=Vitis vinifera TaxID=29760 RepID=D7U3L9_VITVI